MKNQVKIGRLHKKTCYYEYSRFFIKIQTIAIVAPQLTEKQPDPTAYT